MRKRVEAGTKKEGEGLRNSFVVLTGLFLAYMVTLLGLFILALLLLKFNLGKEAVEIGILVIYVLSVFLSGFFMGKVKREKKFLWGMGEGIAYYLVLLLLSFMAQQELGASTGEVFTTFLMCTAGGTLGGMIS